MSKLTLPPSVIRSGEERKYYCNTAPACPQCESSQVQLLRWINVFPPFWRCRKCSKGFTF